MTVMRGSGTTVDGTLIQGEDEEYNVLDKDFYLGEYDVYGMLRYGSEDMEKDGVTSEDFDAAKIAAAGAEVPWGRQTQALQTPIRSSHSTRLPRWKAAQALAQSTPQIILAARRGAAQVVAGPRGAVAHLDHRRGRRRVP